MSNGGSPTELYVTLVLDTAGGGIKDVFVTGAPDPNLYLAVAFSGTITGYAARFPDDPNQAERLSDEVATISRKADVHAVTRKLYTAIENATVVPEQEVQEPPENIGE